MREMKLRYVIDLESKVGAKAQADAKTFEQAQKVMQQAVKTTNGNLADWNKLNGSVAVSTTRMQEVITGATSKFTGLDRVVTRLGANTGIERQATYMRRLASSIDMAHGRAMALQKALTSGGMGKLQDGFMGAAAGGYVLAAALKKPVDYDTRLRSATATALAGEDIGALRAGRGAINALIIDAVRQAPGATRDATLGAFEKLVGSGSFKFEESSSLLPTVMRTAVASGADANDLVQAAEKMKVGLGLGPDQIAVALSKVMRAGQEGGFEIKDAAKWIGPLMPYMKGYQGMAGVEQLVTMLQQVRATAGTNDEAANNLRNFIQKMGADSTRKDFKKQGFDLDAEMAKGVLARQTPIETYMGLLDRVMAKNDPEGKARKAMLKADKAATPEERARQYEDIKTIYQASAISKIINDLQEFGGYEGLKRTKEYGAKVLAAVQSEKGGAVATGFQFMTEGTGAKLQALENNKDIAASNAMDATAGPLNKFLDGTNQLAEKFPALAAAAYSATVALGVLSAASLLRGFAKGGGSTAAAASGGVSAAAKTVAYRSHLSGPLLADVAAAAAAAAAAAPMSAAVLGGAMTGGLVVAGAPILGAGMYLSERANSKEGLVGRIADRNARLGELSELTDLERSGGAKPAAIARLEQEHAQLVADRDALQAKLAAMGGGLATNWRGNGFSDPRRLDLVALTAPGAATEQLRPGQATEVKLGEGRLDLNVSVTDNRVTVTPTVTRPLSLIRINPGNTNPGSATP